MRYPKGYYALVQMVWIPFKVFDMELLSRFNIVMFLCWLGCIVWQIGQIWRSKHFFIYPWWHDYKIWYNPFVIFFYKSLKCHLEFIKLAQIMETKGNKFFHNIKTKWISMLSPMKHVFEYCSLLGECKVWWLTFGVIVVFFAR